MGQANSDNIAVAARKKAKKPGANLRDSLFRCIDGIMR